MNYRCSKQGFISDSETVDMNDLIGESSLGEVVGYNINDEFNKNKKEIISELRDLVLNNKYMKSFMESGDVKYLLTSEAKEKSNRKWDLFLKYADVWDDDLKNLGYLEFKINYAIFNIKNNGLG